MWQCSLSSASRHGAYKPTTQFSASPDTIPRHRMKVMSLASLEAKRTLIRAACFEHKHSGSNILRNLFSSHMKCSRRRHTVISDTRVLRNTTIANSLKKKTCKAHKYGYCRRSNELAEKGASIAFKVTLQRNTQTCTKTGWTV